MVKKMSLAYCIVASAVASSAVVATEIPFPQYSFEQQDISAFNADAGKLYLSQEHFKDGSHSLAWAFPANDTLTLNIAIDLSNDDTILPRTFMAWIYNSKAIDAPFTFTFKQGDKTVKQFEFNLNFTGWRGVAVPFRDMKGDAVNRADSVMIKAPNQAGKVFFDQIMLNIPVDNRDPIPDYQARFVNVKVNTSVNKNWNGLLMYDDMLSKHIPHLNFNTPFSDQGKTHALYEKFATVMGVSQADVGADKIQENLNVYAKFGIYRDEQGHILGKSMDFPARQKFMKNADVFDKKAQDFYLDAIQMRELGKTLLQTAKLLQAKNLSAVDKQQLEQAFLLATQYIFDQGFVRGSGYQIITHLGYQSREMFDAWFIARDLLAENNLLEQAQGAMMWYNGTGRIFESDEEIVSANVDILNTQLQWMVKSILLIPDMAQREALLTQLSNWLSKTILQSKGVSGGFKPDGSIFHHSQHYTAYAKDAFNGLAPTIYVLSGTDYAISPEAHKRLNDVLYKMWVYTKDMNIPVVLSGRHPTGKFKIADTPFKWMALAGEVDNPKRINKTFAGIYAALKGEKAFEGVPAIEEPQGAWAMNYASMALQRRHGEDAKKSWLAVARGFSRYLVGNESYEANNRYGRYLQYGQLELIPSDFSKYAFSYNGWNWNRFPGTTTIQLPFEQLKSQLKQLPAAGLEEMLLSTETYAGANALDNNSMYAVKLHGHSKYQQESFTANKSYFMFDNRIVALGSNIQDDDMQHPTETTLLQYAVANNQPILVNGTEVNKLGESMQFDGEALTLVDPAGNYYYVPKGQRINITYQVQKSLDGRNDKETEGKFATAVINHGKAPKNAGYEYAIVVEPHMPQRPAYHVLARTEKLHAVRDEKTGMEGYAFFEKGEQNQGGVVLSANNPLMVMTKVHDKQLDVSVLNPDLAFYQGVESDQLNNGKQVEVSVYSRQWRANESQEQHSQVTLKGQWQLKVRSACAKTALDGANTTLSTTTRDATPCQIQLTEVK
ncbi:chondroitinase family polysaccharide lyase [Spirabiliibacterium falconis]|uniref:chondroitinase family polysaccharide lyase n=1 Tax=Spirabiliibacterium falconis TaxID=572023 RepID=UPI001AAC5040|nr:chondroitinase family polysaccharide lyase [Spirabiliibacterium falconis]MBE2894259.1 chondroitinase [Spirabiliibacterium falconis]